MAAGTNDEGIAVYCGCGKERLWGESVGGEHLQFASGTKDGCGSRFVEQINAAVGVNRRGGVSTLEAFFPDHFAGLGFEAGGNAAAVDEVQQAIHQQRRTALRHAARFSPCNVRVGHIAIAIGADGPQLRAVAVDGGEDESVPVNGPRCH